MGIEKKIVLAAAAAMAISAALSAANAGAQVFVPQPCTVGSPNCVGSDPDDPTVGTTTNPNDYGTTTTYFGDTEGSVTTPNPAPTATPSVGSDGTRS